MFNKQLSPYTLQWIGLLIAATLLALFFFFPTSQAPKTSMDINHTSLTASNSSIPFISPPSKLTVSSAQEVWDYYQKIGFTMDNLAAGQIDVPRIYLANIINTWAEDKPVTFKKSLFYRTMLPLILRINELIAAERKQLLTLLEKQQTTALKPPESSWLRDLAIDYRVISASYKKPLSDRHLATLVRRVDIIPTSLALGQAAYESAYATSRFAMEGNALFGQWRWGSGLRPAQQRDELGDYRIADFETPLDSMAAFAKNLNTNKAYLEFRQLRSKMRSDSEPLNGYELAAGLEKYSEKGKVYVKTLRGMISQNKLTKLDTLKLGSGRPISLIPNWVDKDRKIQRTRD